MRIGTWNVEYARGVDRNKLRLALLERQKADVWVLTETHDDLDLGSTHAAVSTEQRPTGRIGGRWTTIWSRWPVVEKLDVADPIRTVAALLRAPFGNVIVYGTVLPWHSDTGTAASPAKGWAKQDRVLAEQLGEWAQLRALHPDVPLVVAGDLNMNLGGKHYYGTVRGRKALRDGVANLGLACATETELLPVDALRHPPIDHVVVPIAWMARVRGVSAWEGKTPAPRLSDHSGLVVEIEVGESLPR